MQSLFSFITDPENQSIWHVTELVLIVLGFYFVYRQVRLARDQNSISHLNYFREVWNSDALLRARLAVAEESNEDEVEFEGFEDVVATFMEDLGAAVHAGQANREHVWNYYGYYIEGYWQLLQPKIRYYHSNSGDRTYFERFKWLFDLNAETNKRNGTSSMPVSYLNAFRREEAKAVRFMLGRT